MSEKRHLDNQQVELIGTAALASALIREGFEIAYPNRDHGIDLIVFSDSPTKPFSAIPVQVKAHSKRGLTIHRTKYQKFKGLVYAVVWDAVTPKPRFFLFNHAEAVMLVPARSRQRPCWKARNGHWTWTKVPDWLEGRMHDKFEDRWVWLRSRLTALR